MAKLTLAFKSKIIQVYFFEIGQSISVGRDASNDICIDSLAIAPQHAIIIFDKNTTTISPADTNEQVYVNGEKIITMQLQHGDRIEIGKHTLEYAEEKPAIEIAFKHSDSELAEGHLKPVRKSTQPSIGKLQVIGGIKAGQVIPLNDSQALIGKKTASMVEFIRCNDGYYLSAAKEREAGAIQLNNQPIRRQTLKIADGDYLKIDNAELLFFME